MGVSRRSGNRSRRSRAVVVAGLAVIAVGGTAACEPGGLSTATVAYTTDRTATAELERHKADVRWLNCTASYDDRTTPAPAPTPTPTPTPTVSENTVAEVDCEGRTDDGKDITVTGEVTRAVSGACVRGELVARIDGKERFHVKGLGDCDAKTTPSVGVPGRPGQPGPTVTVTVTQTIWCESYPTCRPVEGK